MKEAYQKPLLRKVQLEVRTSVLAACHTSTQTQPNEGDPLFCWVTECFTHPA